MSVSSSPYGGTYLLSGFNMIFFLKGSHVIEPAIILHTHQKMYDSPFKFGFLCKLVF